MWNSESAPAPPAYGPDLRQTDFRRELSDLITREAGTRTPRHVVVLGLDGVTVEVARACWPETDTRLMRAVRPTTSSAGWMSSLTGLAVAEHGVPGVVFAHPGGGVGLVNVFTYRGPGLSGPADDGHGNIFADAVRQGYLPLAVLGDMETYDSSWRDVLLRDAQPVLGHRFYTEDEGPYRPREPALLESLLREALRGTLAEFGARRPCLLWCYIEVDRHVHQHGYDEHTVTVLEALGRIAESLVEQGAVVVAHSDHGLVPTTHDPQLQRTLDDLGERHGFLMGGAGRMRWLYPAGTTAEELHDLLMPQLPDSVRVLSADAVDALFPPGSAARARVGEVVLLAEGESFLAAPDYCYDHGSFLDAELGTPLTVWS
jgi:Type I phosphodiesterase / nucleotide pyrophosphatase